MGSCFIYVFLAYVIVVTLADINLNIYNNTVLYGAPSKVIPLETLSYSFPYNNTPFSAQIIGSILWPTAVNKYYIECIFNTNYNLRAVVKIDDHLICAPNIYPQTQFEFWNLSWTSAAYQTRKSFIRIDLYSVQQTVAWDKNMDFKIVWSFNDNSSFELINRTYLSNDISTEQRTRMQLQQNLTQNSFSTWFIGNMLSIIKMPDSFGFTFGICDGSHSNDCLLQDIIENDRLWVGVHAYDHSYYEYNISYNQYIIQYQYSSIVKNDSYSHLYVKIKLLSTNAPAPFIAFSSRLYWGRAGDKETVDVVYGDMHCFMRYNAYGLTQYYDICSNINYTKTYNDSLLFQFNDNNVIYFTTDSDIAFVRDIDALIDKYAALEYARYDKYNKLNDTKKAIQSGLMWNLVFTPEESGPYFAVGRAWATASGDYDMIIFDWDNIFASYQLSLDALYLSISNLIQVIKSKTTHGFVPNYKGHGTASEDRTEPPIGSIVLDKMVTKYGDSIRWLIDLLFYDLYDWLNWFWERRRCAPKYLICLGSDPNLPNVENTENVMQAARYESGLDNSPMYDSDSFNTTTHHMMLYDVGMTSMFMNELKHLINLGQMIDVEEDIVNTLKKRYDIMLNLTLNELWNDDMGIFMNKWSQNDTFATHLSPTSFYPLLTGEIDVEKAESMVNNYLLNPDYFCISLDFPLNQSSDCYYGLPSIAKSDIAFKSQNYWRGLTWAPMVQLVWWSLDEYIGTSVVVERAQYALEKQSNAMMLNMWYLKRHICENYSPSNNATECSGDHFYHWGALAGYVSLLRDYY